MDSAKARRISIIRESITKVAKILTDDKVIVTQVGVKAFVHYDEATMKATRVNLPMLPDDASDELIEAVQGFLDGEIAKVLYADPRSALRSKYEQLEGIYKPVESIFCEKSMVKAFPGARSNLNNMHQAFVDKFVEPKLKEALASGASEQELFQVLAVPALRAWGGQQFFKDYMSDKWSLIAGIQKELDPIASKISSMTKPEDAYEMAKKIRNLVMGEPESGDGNNPFGDESSNKSGKGGKGGAGSSRGKGGNKKGMPEEQEEEQGGSGGKPGEEEEESEEGAGGSGGKPVEEEEESKDEGAGEDEESEDESESEDETESEDRPDPADLEPEKLESGEGDSESEQHEREQPTEDEAVTQADSGGASYMKDFDWNKIQDVSNEFGQYVSDLCAAEMQEESYTVFTRDWDQIDPVPIPRGFKTEWLDEIDKAIEGMIGPVARQLERAFTARNKSLWMQGQNKGRMSANNLYRLSAGDDRIFKKKIEHKTREVSVSLVVDCSGSMAGSKIYTAMCSAWVLSEVLQRLGISNEVIGFTTGDLGSDKSRKLYDELRDEWDSGRTWDRREPIRMPIFKAFDERFGIEQKKRMASYARVQGAMASNIDGESIQIAYERLCKNANKGKPKGKMMIVFSDGMPAAGMSSQKLNYHLKKTVKDIEKEGTNIVGVGIMSDSVQNFYRKNVKLDNVEELPGIVLNQLRDALLTA